MGTPRVRRRAQLETLKGVTELYGNGVLQSSHADQFNMYSFAYCADEINEMALMGSGFDVGGPLLALKSETNFPPVAHRADTDAFGVHWSY